MYQYVQSHKAKLSFPTYDEQTWIIDGSLLQLAEMGFLWTEIPVFVESLSQELIAVTHIVHAF